MKRRVQWSRGALDDLLAQARYIALDNPAAARRVATRIRAAGLALGEHSTGRPGRLMGTREKVVTGLPYILVYALDLPQGDATVSILRVIHNAQDWPPRR